MLFELHAQNILGINIILIFIVYRSTFINIVRILYN